MKEEVCSECQNINGEHKPHCARDPLIFHDDTALDALPCPFCGSKIIHEALCGGWWSFYCAGCGCRTPLSEYTTRVDALAMWNERTPTT